MIEPDTAHPTDRLSIDRQESEAEMYTRIVVPLDGSALAEVALPHAEELSRMTGAPLHLVRIVDVVTGRRMAVTWRSKQLVLRRHWKSRNWKVRTTWPH